MQSNESLNNDMPNYSEADPAVARKVMYSVQLLCIHCWQADVALLPHNRVADDTVTMSKIYYLNSMLACTQNNRLYT